MREDGQAVGVVQWINLDLADGISFSIPVVKGQELDLTVGHDRVSLIVLPSSQSLA